jgi:hypothetical protein
MLFNSRNYQVNEIRESKVEVLESGDKILQEEGSQKDRIDLCRKTGSVVLVLEKERNKIKVVDEEADTHVCNLVMMDNGSKKVSHLDENNNELSKFEPKLSFFGGMKSLFKKVDIDKIKQDDGDTSEVRLKKSITGKNSLYVSDKTSFDDRIIIAMLIIYIRWL